MSLKRLFVVDKNHQAQCLKPVVEKFFPHDQISFLPLFTYGLHEFDFPRGLRMYDYPFTGYPQLKVGGADQFIKDPSIRERLESADEIFFACSPDHTGGVSFYLTIATYLGVEKAQQKFPAIKLDSLTEKSITNALLHCGSTHDDWCMELLRYGVAKRYFDYNFHVNSMGLFGSVLRHIGVDTRYFTISKNAVQLLYYVQKVGRIQVEALLKDMRNWQGTGKYKQQSFPSPELESEKNILPLAHHLKNEGFAVGEELLDTAKEWHNTVKHKQPPMYREASLGSPASQRAIIDTLVKNGLLNENDKHVAISEKGQLFLSNLHPECYDPDLPFRLQMWCEDWDNSMPKIDRYLRTFFGRQKRFFGKKLREEKEPY